VTFRIDAAGKLAGYRTAQAKQRPAGPE
jgi:hypothetical protein